MSKFSFIILIIACFSAGLLISMVKTYYSQITTWQDYYDYSFSQHVEDLKYVDDCFDRDLGTFCECAKPFPIIYSIYDCNCDTTFF